MIFIIIILSLYDYYRYCYCYYFIIIVIVISTIIIIIIMKFVNQPSGTHDIFYISNNIPYLALVQYLLSIRS